MAQSFTDVQATLIGIDREIAAATANIDRLRASKKATVQPIAKNLLAFMNEHFCLGLNEWDIGDEGNLIRSCSMANEGGTIDLLVDAGIKFTNLDSPKGGYGYGDGAPPPLARIAIDITQPDFLEKVTRFAARQGVGDPESASGKVRVEQSQEQLLNQLGASSSKSRA